MANAVVDMNPLGSAGLGENSPHWARKSLHIISQTCSNLFMFESVHTDAHCNFVQPSSPKIVFYIDFAMWILCVGDHDYIVDEIKKAAISVEEVISVSEVQLYYKDNGEIASKLDIVLHPQLTIKQAHSIAGN